MCTSCRCQTCNPPEPVEVDGLRRPFRFERLRCCVMLPDDQTVGGWYRCSSPAALVGRAGAGLLYAVCDNHRRRIREAAPA